MNLDNLSREEFKILYGIEFLKNNDSKSLSGYLDISEEKAKKLLIDLEKQSIIEIEIREGKIYGSQLIGKAKKIFYSDKYLNFKVELGY